MSLKTLSDVVPITALAVDVERGILYHGSGGTLKAKNLTPLTPSAEAQSNNLLSLNLFETHAIYGIKPIKGSDVARCLVFGGKSVSVVILDDVSTYRWAIQYLNQENDDWILDCSLVHRDDREILVLGFAHNFVDAVHLDRDNSSDSYTARVLIRIHCPEICVLFSLSFAPSSLEQDSSNELVIASGTAFGKIIVWKVPLDIAQWVPVVQGVSTGKPTRSKDTNRSALHQQAAASAVTVIHTLTDHKGVVFNIRWTKDSQYIASVSDDRTVRLWDLRPKEPVDVSTGSSGNESRQIFVGWGHVSRVWDVAFVGDDAETSIATCSEDGTVKIWDISKCMGVIAGAERKGEGSCIATLRGHSSSVWRIVYLPEERSHTILTADQSSSAITSSNKSSSETHRMVVGRIKGTLISCGNDGSIKTWPVSPHLLGSSESSSASAQVLRIPLDAVQEEKKNIRSNDGSKQRQSPLVSDDNGTVDRKGSLSAAVADVESSDCHDHSHGDNNGHIVANVDALVESQQREPKQQQEQEGDEGSNIDTASVGAVHENKKTAPSVVEDEENGSKKNKKQSKQKSSSYKPDDGISGSGSSSSTSNGDATKSRRSNGVCTVRASPDGSWALVFLIDGGIWLVDLSAAAAATSTAAAGIDIGSPPATTTTTTDHSSPSPASTTNSSPQTSDREEESGSTSSSRGSSSDRNGWVYVASTGKPVTGADALLTTSNNTRVVGDCVCAHPDGYISRVAFDVVRKEGNSFSSSTNSTTSSTSTSTSRCSYDIIKASVDNWLAHDLRAINVWYVIDRKRGGPGDHSSRSSLGNAILSATVKGLCKLWVPSEIQSQHRHEEGEEEYGTKVPVSPATYQLAAELKTKREQIATSCLLLSNGDLAVGDSRGGISIFNLTHLATASLSSRASIAPISEEDDDTCGVTTTRTALLQLSLYIDHAHGTDPVSFLSLCDDDAFCSVGHDGYLSIFRESDGSLVSRLTCLPIKTPMMVEIVGSGPDVSIYVGGFLGGLFILWDVRRGYQLMRVEAGSWKRPHHAAICFTHDANDANDVDKGSRVIGAASGSHQLLPRVVLLCATPEGKTDTVLQVWDTQPLTGTEENVILEKDGWCRSRWGGLITPPIHMGTVSHGEVAYCGEFLNCSGVNDGNDGRQQPPCVVAVGGEDGSLRIFQYSYKEERMLLLQEAAMPANVAVKAVASSRDSDALQRSPQSISPAYPHSPQSVSSADLPGDGIVVAAGGRLSYSIWKYNNGRGSGNRTKTNSESRLDSPSAAPLSCLLSFECSGTIWPKATQDHRILTTTCRTLTTITTSNTTHEDERSSSSADNSNHDLPAPCTRVPTVQAVPIDSLPVGAHTVPVVARVIDSESNSTAGQSSTTIKSPPALLSPPAAVLPDSKYLIVFGDSRGIVTLATYHNGTDELPNEAKRVLKKMKKGLDIVEEVQVSEFPILSSDVLIFTAANTTNTKSYSNGDDNHHTNSSVNPNMDSCGSNNNSNSTAAARYVLGYFGDTTGVVSIWLLKSTILSNGEPLKSSRLLAQYHAHAMGANGLSAIRLSRPHHAVTARRDEGGNLSGKLCWHFFVGSGGDDQSLAVCWGELLADHTNAESLELRISFDRADGCSGSAIKGVRVLEDRLHASKNSPGRSVYIVAVGYDQRLNIWSPISPPTTMPSPSPASQLETATASISDKNTANTTSITTTATAAVGYEMATMQLVHDSLLVDSSPSAIAPLQPSKVNLASPLARNHRSVVTQRTQEEDGARAEEKDEEEKQNADDNISPEQITAGTGTGGVVTGAAISSMGDSYVHTIFQKRNSILKWVGGRVVHTGDVAAVDALWFRDDDYDVGASKDSTVAASKNVPITGVEANPKKKHQSLAGILVVGEGFEIFEVDSFHC